MSELALTSIEVRQQVADNRGRTQQLIYRDGWMAAVGASMDCCGVGIPNSMRLANVVVISSLETKNLLSNYLLSNF